MNTSVRSLLKESMVFAGLLGAALLAAELMPQIAFATEAINPDDNPAIVSNLTGGEGDLRDLIKTLLNYFLGFLGFVATLMVIYGGILYVTAAGNEDNAGKGKTVMMQAAIGIIIIMISFALVNTILGAGSGDDDSVNSGGGTTPTVVQ